MKKMMMAVLFLAVVSLCTNSVFANSMDNVSITGVQIYNPTGVPQLYVYASGLPGGAYLHYSGSDQGVLKLYLSQFLYAKATGKNVTVSYTPGNPSNVWELWGVIVY